MRKRIRLTGRKQLPKNAVTVKVFSSGERKLVALSITDQKTIRKLPRSARVKLRLIENKFSETLDFGSLDNLKTTVELGNVDFSAPSCQLRIVAETEEKHGILLASTDNWTLKTGDESEGDGGSEGILLFQPANIDPRVWKLSIRDDEYPVVYVDKAIPNPAMWVKNDPIFAGCVLPAIIKEVFDDILKGKEKPDREWMKDWVAWADTLMPGSPPPWADGALQKQEWVDRLIESFCQKFKLHKCLIDELTREEAA